MSTPITDLALRFVHLKENPRGGHGTAAAVDREMREIAVALIPANGDEPMGGLTFGSAWYKRTLDYCRAALEGTPSTLTEAKAVTRRFHALDSQHDSLPTYWEKEHNVRDMYWAAVALTPVLRVDCIGSVGDFRESVWYTRTLQTTKTD